MEEKISMQREKTRVDPYSLGYIIDYWYRYTYIWDDYIIDKWYNIIDNWPTIIHKSIQHYLNAKFGIDINFLFFDESYNDKDKDKDWDWDSDRDKGWDWDCDWDCDKDKDWDCDKDCDYDKLRKDSETEIDSINDSDEVQKDSSVFETENDNNNESDKVQKDNSVLETENDSNNESDKVQKDSEIESSSIITRPNDFSHLWVACDECYGMNYKKYFKSKMNICEYCGCHLKMSSSDRIELLIDPGTWNPMDEDMVSVDPIEFNSENSLDSDDYPNSSEDEPSENDDYPTENSSEDEDEPTENSSEDEDEDEDEPTENSSEDEDEDEPSENDDYPNRLDSNQDKTGLLEAVQTGTGQLNGIPVAIGIMDFEFMGGSMGSVVGEKITRLIEYATDQLLPLILVCASGGARMQEGSLSLMQMAKISSALYNYQINKKLFYITILTSPTTGGITASFGMLGDIIIAEPDAYIAFAGKRVIEETLKIEVPEGVQTAEFLFEKGAFDSIVPRNSLKEVLSELYHFHGIFPLTQTEK